MTVQFYTDEISKADDIHKVEDLHMNAMIDPEISVVQLIHIAQAARKREYTLHQQGNGNTTKSSI